MNKECINQVQVQDISIILRIHFLENEMKLLQMRVSYLEEEIKQKNTRIYAKQIERLIFKNQKQIWCEDDDIDAALTLRSICGIMLVYHYLDYLLFENGLATQSVYLASKTNYFHGSLLLSSRERLAVLSFDEIIDSRMCYDQREDRIMALIPTRLFKVIKEVEEAGFNVVAIVSDMGGRN
ncbi:hypothetical protein PR048_000006 [Dryococelus australis]|uniref:Uncharacterized protein n=1 Tax=Dryococelus australis TaxID=614101 RepID=A0ABQ9IEM5_9NEOP|nr:hypothetical protein PR048_000006 [Dryococelus australis]